MKTMIQATALGAMALLGTMFASSASAQHCHGNSGYGGYRPLQPTPYSSYYGGGNYSGYHHHHNNYQPSYPYGGYGGYGYQPNYYGPNVNYRPYYGNQGGFGMYGAGGNGVYIRW